MTLRIPPGALRTDTDIIISEEDAGGGMSIGPVYDIQPDGLTLQKPVTLTVRYTADDVPEGLEIEDVAITQIIPPNMSEMGDMGMEIPAGWEYLETTVDTQAGTASTQIAHFSRYGARAYASYRLGEFEQRDIVGLFDYGMKFSQTDGAGSAKAGYGLAGHLFAQASVPVGSDGMAMAHADMAKWFLIKPGYNGQTHTEEGTISVYIYHDGQFGAGTNQYNITFDLQCYDETPESVGTPYVLTPSEDTGGRYQLTGMLNQAFYADPVFTHTQFPFGPRYQPGTFHLLFRNCNLEAGRFYAITIGLTATVTGNPPDPKSGDPARGGSVEFMGVLSENFFVHSIHVEA